MNGGTTERRTGRDPDSERSSRSTLRFPGLVKFCTSTRWEIVGAIGLVVLATTWVYVVERTRGSPVDVTSAILTQLPLTAPTLLLAPAITRLARRFPIDLEHWARSLGVHALGLVTTILVHGCLTTAGMWWLTPQQTGGLTGLDLFWSLVGGLFYLWVLVYVGLVGLVHAYDNFWRWRDTERTAQRLETRLLEAQLASLRGRLQPHFLFNTLQAIAGLVTENPSAARSMLTRLGDLLRASLSTSRRNLVPLEQEVAIVRDYLDIQSTRFGDRLTTKIQVEDDVLDVRVPGFLLQPLVENALGHGLSPERQPGTVEVLGRREGSDVVLFVRDDGGGERPEPPQEWTEGVGLAATRQRLEALYGDSHSMSVRVREHGGVEVEIRLPCEGANGSRERTSGVAAR